MGESVTPLIVMVGVLLFWFLVVLIVWPVIRPVVRRVWRRK